MEAARSSETLISYHNTRNTAPQLRRPRLEFSPPQKPQISHIQFYTILCHVRCLNILQCAAMWECGRDTAGPAFQIQITDTVFCASSAIKRSPHRPASNQRRMFSSSTKCGTENVSYTQYTEKTEIYFGIVA